MSQWQSSYLFQIETQTTFQIISIAVAPFTMLWQSMGLMMFGAYLYRNGFFNEGFSSASFIKVAAIAIVTSIATTLPLILIKQVTADVTPMLSSVPAIFCALVYAHLFVKVKNTAAWWYQSLVNCGKMAFTLYLTQSMAMAVLFRIVMPAYFPDFAFAVTLLDLLIITLAFTAIQIVLANIITKHFRQGPFEALWRKLYLHSFYKKRTKEHLAL